MTKIQASHIGQLIMGMGWISSSQLEHALALAMETNQPLGRLLVAHGHMTDAEILEVIDAQCMLRDYQVTTEQARQGLTLATWMGVSFDDALLMCGIRPDASAGDNRLGQLLLDSECLGESDIDYYVAASRQAGLQMGRFLVLRKLLTKSMLAVVLETQRLLRTGLLGYDQAIAGLRVLEPTLREYAPADECGGMKLGRLLVNAGIVSESHLIDALRVSQVNRQPLGQVLVLFALLSDGTLQAALNLQNLVRSSKLRAHRAVEALNLVVSQNYSLNSALASIGGPDSGDFEPDSLSDFLKRTGLFRSVFRELDHVARGYSRSQQLDSLRAFIEEDKLRIAVRCTFLIKRSIITLEQALLAFHQCLLNNCDIDQFLLEAGWIDEHTLDVITNRPITQHLRIVA